MNASVRLLEQTLPATVHLQVSVPDAHPSVPVLGTERAGTGTVVGDDGLILTVNYVVLGAREATITTVTVKGSRTTARMCFQASIRRGSPLPRPPIKRTAPARATTTCGNGTG